MTLDGQLTPVVDSENPPDKTTMDWKGVSETPAIIVSHWWFEIPMYESY